MFVATTLKCFLPNSCLTRTVHSYSDHGRAPPQLLEKLNNFQTVQDMTAKLFVFSKIFWENV